MLDFSLFYSPMFRLLVAFFICAPMVGSVSTYLPAMSKERGLNENQRAILLRWVRLCSGGTEPSSSDESKPSSSGGSDHTQVGQSHPPQVGQSPPQLSKSHPPQVGQTMLRWDRVLLLS